MAYNEYNGTDSRFVDVM